MKLHQLSNTFLRKPRKRVGRGDGSGQGRTAGRGEKGQGSRTGSGYRPYFEGGQIPFLRRLPKRGFTNPNQTVYSVVNIRYLDQNFNASDQVDQDVLQQRGLIRKLANGGLKILGDGDIGKPLTVKANKFSASAKRKIEAAGGVCQVV
ncbi:MAG: 50S ribosomal protein L15 [Lentisphaerae bacterium RIFOXYB12_FULL_65_16]|nr:MAG: 50S ribosomal protein L15 [Lentisphaerae bacterium RIFOXYA12_64_32]OGV90147.1 MAG: 50S ribosomal protein L15 [Lentisphaerae bacterium RIFOXYB12_FULL_65_16]